MNPYQDYIQDWQAQAPDYPSQALLQVASDLYQQQEDRRAGHSALTPPTRGVA